MNKHLVNLINNIKMAYKLKKKIVKVPKKKSSLEVIKLLSAEGYIRLYNIINDKHIIILLSNYDDAPSTVNIKLVSTPGRRVYNSLKNIKNKGNYNTTNNVTVLSTTSGYITKEKGIENKQGGEIICTLNK